MRTFIAACACALVVAIGSAVILNSVNKPAESAYASPSGARI